MRATIARLRRAWTVRRASPTVPSGLDAIAGEDLLALLREPGAFQVQIAHRRAGWSVTVARLDGSSTSTGRGATFAQAWFRHRPRR